MKSLIPGGHNLLYDIATSKAVGEVTAISILIHSLRQKFPMLINYDLLPAHLASMQVIIFHCPRDPNLISMVTLVFLTILAQLILVVEVFP